jgi:hypothetical protein
MDGNVEVERMLMDYGEKVKMKKDRFEYNLKMDDCGGHVDLAMMIIERGEKIEEVNHHP